MTTKYSSIVNTRPFMNALTILERKELFSSLGATNLDETKLTQWVNTRGLSKENEFNTMLDYYGLSKEQFNLGFASFDDIDGADYSALLSQHDWFNQFVRIMDAYYEQKDVYEQQIQSFDFSLSVTPFLLWAASELTPHIKQLHTITLEAAAIQSIYEKIANSLVHIGSKSMVWDMHQHKNTHGIEGEDPAQRFTAFVRMRFANYDNLVQFYSVYPVLARRITTKCVFLVTYFKEMLSNLDNRFHEAAATLHLNPQLTKITSISCDQGDTHDQAKFVIKVMLNEAETILYKPRDLRIQHTFAQWVDWFNTRSGLLDLRVNNALYGEGYTLETFIPYQDCKTEEEVQRYYTRFGQMCALLYVLRGNDIHYENIIAYGEYPIIIDLETLFQQQSNSLNFEDDALSVAFIECIESVAGTGLLPIPSFSKGQSKGIDVSGLNGDTQMLPFQVLGVTDSSTDTMRYEYQNVMIKGANNIVLLNGSKVNYSDYKMNIVSGFEAAMAFVIQHKQQIVDEVLPLFKGMTIRHLLKATHNYAKLNEFSSHPNYTSDMLKMERLFFNTWGYNYVNKSCVPYEINDLLNDDIPIFYGQPDSRELVSSTGDVIGNYFREDTYSMVCTFIGGLTEHQVLKQVSHMKVTLGLYDQADNSEECTNNRLPAATPTADLLGEHTGVLLEEANRIAETIMEDSIWSKDRRTVNWNNVMYDDIHHCWKVRPLDGGLYQGLPGIMLFLHYLDQANGNSKYANVIEVLMHSIVSSPLSDKGLSAYYDSASALFPLAAMYADSRSDELYNQIMRYSTYLRDNHHLVQHRDWINGHAGIVKLMVTLHHMIEEPVFLEIAGASVQSIREQLTMEEAAELRIGMAHGLIGLISALQAYTAAAPHEETQRWVIELTDLARSLLKEQKIESTSWCNGMVGIRYALTAPDLLDNETREYVHQLTMQQLAAGLKQEDSLCHGNMGDLHLLYNIHEATGDLEVKQLLIDKLGSILAEAKEQGDYRYRTVPGFTTVGLFTGLTGIGYTILRLIGKGKVPDVLNLAIPV